MAFLAPDAIDVAVLTPLAADELDLHDAIGELLRLSLVDREGGAAAHARPAAGRHPEPAAGAGPPGAVRRRGRAVRRPVPRRTTPARRPGRRTWSCWPGTGRAWALVPDRLVESLSALARRYAARALYPAATQVLDAALRLVRVPADAPTATGRCWRAGCCASWGRSTTRPAGCPRRWRCTGTRSRMLQRPGRPGRHRAGARAQPARARAQLRRRHRGRDRRAPRALAVLDRAGPRRPAATGADRPRLHAVGGRPARGRRRGAAGGPGRAGRPGPPRRPGLGARHRRAGHGRAGQRAARRGRRAPAHGDRGVHPGLRGRPPGHRAGAGQARLRAAAAGRAGRVDRPAASARCGCWSGCSATTTPGSAWR